MSAPGTERILENLFTHDGASAKRYDVALSGAQWKDIACKLISVGVGTPLGYITNEGEVITNPHYERTIDGKALLVMVSDEVEFSNEMMQKTLA